MAVDVGDVESDGEDEQDECDDPDSRISLRREDDREHGERNEKDERKEAQAFPDSLTDGDDGVKIQTRSGGAEKAGQRKERSLGGNELRVELQIFFGIEDLFLDGWLSGMKALKRSENALPVPVARKASKGSNVPEAKGSVPVAV